MTNTSAGSITVDARNDPRATTPGSNMPSYNWLATSKIDVPLASKKLALMQKLGVPYTNAQVDSATEDQKAQASTVVADLKVQGVNIEWDTEIVALISYLQRLGRDRGISFPAPTAQAVPSNAGGQ